MAFIPVIGQAPQWYDGPGEIGLFADYLIPIGEIVIAFSRVERWLTWATKSVLKIRTVDADAIQETIMSVSTRINLFATLASTHVVQDQPESAELTRIVKRMHEANGYRNEVPHGAWTGIQASFDTSGEAAEITAVKVKYAQLGAKSQLPKEHLHSALKMREEAKAMLILCTDIQRWTMATFPHAEARVP